MNLNPLIVIDLSSAFVPMCVSVFYVYKCVCGGAGAQLGNFERVAQVYLHIIGRIIHGRSPS